MSLEIKFETFKSYYEKGMSEHTKGNFETSKDFLLKAVELCDELSSLQPTSKMKAEFNQKGMKILNFIRMEINTKATKLTSQVNKKNEEDDEVAFKPIIINKNLTFDDIIGADEAVEKAKTLIIDARIHADKYKKYGIHNSGGSILLYGEPGTGKTLFAQVIAAQLDVNFYEVKCSKLVNKYLGDTEKAINKLFNDVRKNLPAIIFFDEFEDIGGKRNEENKVTSSTVNTLLTELEGFSSDLKELLVIGATNHPDRIDGALLSRFGINQFYFPLPDQKARKELFIMYLEKDLVKSNNINYEELASKSNECSGRDISNICKEVRIKLIQRDIITNQDQICSQDDVLKEISDFKRRSRK